MSAYRASCVGATRRDSAPGRRVLVHPGDEELDELSSATVSPAATQARSRSEGVRDSFQLAHALDDDVEADVTRAVLRVRGEPRGGGAPQATHLLRGHHLQWITESRSAFALDLDEG